jgi:hypothetical protein
VSLGIGASKGVAFLVSAAFVADIIAKACSSPQTTDLNAKARAPTLMKWVNIGTVEAAALVAVAVYIDPKYRVPIIMGAVTEGVITYGEYMYAKQSGLKSTEPPTESY